MKNIVQWVVAVGLVLFISHAEAQTSPQWETEPITIIQRDGACAPSPWNSWGVTCFPLNVQNTRFAVWNIPAGVINITDWGSHPDGTVWIYPIVLGPEDGTLRLFKYGDAFYFNSMYQGIWMSRPYGSTNRCTQAEGFITNTWSAPPWPSVCYGMCPGQWGTTPTTADWADLVGVWVGNNPQRLVRDFRDAHWGPYPGEGSPSAGSYRSWYGYTGENLTNDFPNQSRPLPGGCNFVFYRDSQRIAEVRAPWLPSFIVPGPTTPGAVTFTQLIMSGSMWSFMNESYPQLPNGLTTWDNFCPGVTALTRRGAVVNCAFPPALTTFPWSH